VDEGPVRRYQLVGPEKDILLEPISPASVCSHVWPDPSDGAVAIPHIRSLRGHKSVPDPAHVMPARFFIFLRSADSVLRYLGAVARTGNTPCVEPLGRGPTGPPCVEGSGEDARRDAVFRIRGGRPGPDGSLLTITYRGERFHIPGSEVGTLQTLSLISQILSLNTSTKDLPTTPTVIGVSP
jgi:hypothetical protein